MDPRLAALFVVMDSVAQSTTGPIMSFPSDAVAVRTFSDAIRGSNSVLAAHPDDYSLYAVGFLNTDSGILVPLDSPRFVISARSIVDLVVDSPSPSSL